MNKECRALKKWLAQPGNSAALLANKLGYSSSTTISQWFTRGQISKFRVKEVMEIIKKGGNGK